MKKKDLLQIKELINAGFQENKPLLVSVFNEAFGQIWEYNLEPSFNQIHSEIDNIKKTISNLPTKSYIDDRLANIKVEIDKSYLKKNSA